MRTVMLLLVWLLVVALFPGFALGQRQIVYSGVPSNWSAGGMSVTYSGVPGRWISSKRAKATDSKGQVGDQKESTSKDEPPADQVREITIQDQGPSPTP